ncbi:DUF4390 domain-containing protein [Oxalobacteraceae bacterium CAVE-383]|nr:DUF4390 domain-containing protein [Oxalobacteraceae bacterium CAVE-383]
MQATRRNRQHGPAAADTAARRRSPYAGLPGLLHAGLLLLCLIFAGFHAVSARAADIDILRASIDSTDEGYRLSTAYAFELNHGLESTIMRGVPLYFTTEVELTRRRWYWLDETAVRATQTTRVSYNVLTRQYHASINNSLQQNFNTLEDAMALVRRPPRWIIADLKALQPGEVYNVAVRMQLDIAQLSKPFQVNALNNSDWRLSSDWINFSYKPE